jgi:hypothetical protein
VTVDSLTPFPADYPAGTTHDTAPALKALAWPSAAAPAMAPLQDLLNLGKKPRTNVSGRVDGNWRRRRTEDMIPDPLNKIFEPFGYG